MMIATDSIHEPMLAVVARRTDGQDDYVMQSFHFFRSVGFGQGRVKV